MNKPIIPENDTISSWLTRPLMLTTKLDMEKTIYLIIAIIALITRLWGVGNRVVSHDESLHTQYSYQYYNGDGYQHTPLMHGPSLFHITALSFWLFGDNDTSARIPVALVGVILVLLPYLTRSWIGKTGALVASTLLLISPFITYYSRYIRHDIYVIVAAVIVFLSSQYYLRKRKDKYLWWFAIGMGLLFTTMETSFIYVAIFGSFILLALLARIATAEWLRDVLPAAKVPLLIIAISLVVFAGGFAGQRFAPHVIEQSDVTPTEEPAEGFAADPDEALPATEVVEKESSLEVAMRWLQVAGLITFSAGLFLTARSMRPHIDSFGEFDLVVLFTSLTLPTVTSFLVLMVGRDPLAYTIKTCELVGQETMSAFQLFFAKVFNSTCVSAFFSSEVAISTLFLIFTLVVSVLLGLWWNRRKWIVVGAIFHAIFFLLFSSLGSNPSGWASGMLSSLGYWLAQQEVQRADQPTYFYGLVLPLYEFLALFLSLAATRLWAKKFQLNKIVGYWLTLALSSITAYSLINWFLNREVTADQELNHLTAKIVFASILLIGILYWYFVRRRQLLVEYMLIQKTSTLLIGDLLGFIGLAGLTYAITGWIVNPSVTAGETANRLPSLILAVLVALAVGVAWFIYRRRSLPLEYGMGPNWPDRQRVDASLGFVPFLIWWSLVNWIIYSFAGEKMAWLSTHFMFPMVLLGGYYLQQTFSSAQQNEVRSKRFAILVALTAFFILLLAVSFAPVILGKIELGNQATSNLRDLGRFLGSFAFVIGTAVILVRYSRRFEIGSVKRAWLLAIIALLSLLTVRFSYMASFPNADYVNEYLVYAHGAPATKSEVLPQLEELSMRLHGDKSIKVAFDNDSSWPYTWYLREYPNRIYFGENPGRNIIEAPVVIVGSLNWGKVEPILGDDYESHTYTYLWWPMEEYRNLSWNAVFGNKLAEESDKRGLGKPAVRQALWDIFFYRDFEKYSQVFGGTFTAGQWPLRHELRMYIRKDAIASIWDHGIDAVYVEPPIDPYAENEFIFAPTISIDGLDQAGGPLLNPRNLAIGKDGLLFVADSGNHQIQVFDQDGSHVRSWGEYGTAPGQFNEPWGIAADDDFVYVADLWNHRIQKFTYSGSYVGTMGQSGSPTQDDPGGGLFFGPRDIAIMPDGDLLITDAGNHRLQILNTDGEFIDVMGSQGSLPGQFFEPIGIDFSKDGRLYLADTWNGRIQMFNTDLLPLYEWSVDAWLGDSIENKPYIALDHLGRVYVSDPEGYRILIFDEAGQYVGRFGRYSTETDGFGLPNGIKIDSAGYVFVADAGNNRILKFPPLPLNPPDTAPQEIGP